MCEVGPLLVAFCDAPGVIGKRACSSIGQLIACLVQLCAAQEAYAYHFASQDGTGEQARLGGAFTSAPNVFMCACSLIVELCEHGYLSSFWLEQLFHIFFSTEIAIFQIIS